MYIHDVSVWRVSVGVSHANYYTYMYYFITFCFVMFFYVLMHFEFCTCVDWNDGIHDRRGQRWADRKWGDDNDDDGSGVSCGVCLSAAWLMCLRRLTTSCDSSWTITRSTKTSFKWRVLLASCSCAEVLSVTPPTNTRYVLLTASSVAWVAVDLS